MECIFCVSITLSLASLIAFDSLVWRWYRCFCIKLDFLVRLLVRSCTKWTVYVMGPCKNHSNYNIFVCCAGSSYSYALLVLTLIHMSINLPDDSNIGINFALDQTIMFKLKLVNSCINGAFVVSNSFSLQLPTALHSTTSLLVLSFETKYDMISIWHSELQNLKLFFSIRNIRIMMPLLSHLIFG